MLHATRINDHTRMRHYDGGSKQTASQRIPKDPSHHSAAFPLAPFTIFESHPLPSPPVHPSLRAVHKDNSKEHVSPYPQAP